MLKSSNKRTSQLVCAALLLLVGLLTVPTKAANPTYLSQVLVPADFASDTTVQFACSISVTHSGSGVIVASRIVDDAELLITVYDNTLKLLAEEIAENFVTSGVNTTTLSCKAVLSDDLDRFVVSIASPTIGDATNPAKVQAFLRNTAGSYYAIQSWTGTTSNSVARSVDMSADGKTLVFSVPYKLNYTLGQIQVWALNATNTTAYYLKQTLTSPLNESIPTLPWTEDIAISANGLVVAANSPNIGSIYLYNRTDSNSNFTFTALLSFNTSGTPFTSIAMSGDGKTVAATYYWKTTYTLDNSTSTFDGVVVWTFDDSTQSWPTDPANVNFGVATVNVTSGKTTYPERISSPVSLCKEGKAFMVPVYVNSTVGGGENVLFAVFESDGAGDWVVTGFPAPANSTWLLPSSKTIQQISPTPGSGIGFGHMMSDAGNLALVPTQQSNSSGYFAYWADAYVAVTNCDQNPPSPVAPPIAGSAVGQWIIVAVGIVGFLAFIGVAAI